MSIARAYLWAASLTAIALAFPLSAYAQSISADPAEVIFYTKSPNKQKSTTITWDAAQPKDAGPAVYYKINGAGETQWATGPTGPKTAKFIKLNNTYEFCLWANNHTQKLVCTTVTTKYVEVKIDLGFIHDVKPEPNGHSVKISFTTKRKAPAVVQIGDKPPKKPFPLINKDDLPAWNSPSDIVSVSLPSFNTTHSPTLPKLEPNKEFFFVIASHDPLTDLWFKVQGKFSTKRRSVTVNFQKVKVIDDSDDLSPGDLMFGFFINGQNAPNGKAMTFGTHASSGETKTANVSGTVVGAPQTLTLKATGYDDDEMEWIPIGPFVAVLLNTCGDNVIDPGKDEGQNSCGEWTSGSKSFDLKSLGENAANIEDFTVPFTIQAHPKGDDSEVSFDVTGTFRVRHVP